MPLALFVRPDHHGHGVPADDAFDASLHLAVAGVIGLIFKCDGVHIRSCGNARKIARSAKNRAVAGGQEDRPAPGPGRGNDVIQGI